MCAEVAPSGECLRGYKPGAVVSSRLAPRVAASCLCGPVVIPGLRASICRAVLRGSLYVLSYVTSLRLSSWILKGDYYYYYY